MLTIQEQHLLLIRLRLIIRHEDIAMMKNIKNKGQTVVELIIYLALLSIFLTVLLDIFVTTLNFKLQAEAASALNQDSRYILGKISYDVYNSDSFTVPSQGELDITTAGITKKYSVNSGDLIIDGTKLNSLDTKVNNLIFTKIGTTVTVNFTLQSINVLPGAPRTESITVTLANRK